MSQERTKLWYLKNLDLFSHMRKDDGSGPKWKS
jgi:hypothetical protein